MGNGYDSDDHLRNNDSGRIDDNLNEIQQDAAREGDLANNDDNDGEQADDEADDSDEAKEWAME